MKSKYFLFLTIFSFTIISCGKYSSSEKEMIKVKVLEMYKKLPSASMDKLTKEILAENLSHEEINKRVAEFEIKTGVINELYKKQIKDDELLMDYFSNILKKDRVTVENANFQSLKLKEHIAVDLKMSQSEIEILLGN